MISESWLKERLETIDLREVFKREVTGAGLSASDAEESLARGVSPQWAEKWRAFVAQMMEGDELWSFTSPPETWNDFAGRAGYAVVRSGRVVDAIVSRMN